MIVKTKNFFNDKKKVLKEILIVGIGIGMASSFAYANVKYDDFSSKTEVSIIKSVNNNIDKRILQTDKSIDIGELFANIDDKGNINNKIEDIDIDKLFEDANKNNYLSKVNESNYIDLIEGFSNSIDKNERNSKIDNIIYNTKYISPKIPKNIKKNVILAAKIYVENNKNSGLMKEYKNDDIRIAKLSAFMSGIMKVESGHINYDTYATSPTGAFGSTQFLGSTAGSLMDELKILGININDIKLSDKDMTQNLRTTIINKIKKHNKNYSYSERKYKRIKIEYFIKNFKYSLYKHNKKNFIKNGKKDNVKLKMMSLKFLKFFEKQENQILLSLILCEEKERLVDRHYKNISGYEKFKLIARYYNNDKNYIIKNGKKIQVRDHYANKVSEVLTTIFDGKQSSNYEIDLKNKKVKLSSSDNIFPQSPQSS